jgi:hypothetical protein
MLAKRNIEGPGDTAAGELQGATNLGHKQASGIGVPLPIHSGD